MPVDRIPISINLGRRSKGAGTRAARIGHVATSSFRETICVLTETALRPRLLFRHQPFFPSVSGRIFLPRVRKRKKDRKRRRRKKRFQFNPCQRCLLRIESFVIDKLSRYVRRILLRKREEEKGNDSWTDNSFEKLPQASWLSSSSFFPFFFFSSLFVWKSSIGRKTFWKYEGADGIVFNEVWPELHLPLSRHLGPAAVTLPRAQFKKLAGTHPSFLQIRSSSIYLQFYRALNPFLPLSFVSRSIFSIDPRDV